MNILGPKKGRRKRNLRDYAAAVKGLKNTLKERIIRFTEKENANLEILKSEKEFLKEMI